MPGRGSAEASERGKDVQPVGTAHRAEGDVGGDDPMRRHAGPQLTVVLVILVAERGEEPVRRRVAAFSAMTR